jgi:hypothetical protein
VSPADGNDDNLSRRGTVDEFASFMPLIKYFTCMYNPLKIQMAGMNREWPACRPGN